MHGHRPSDVNHATSNNAHRARRARDSAPITVTRRDIKIGETLTVRHAGVGAHADRRVADGLDADTEDGIGKEDGDDVRSDGVWSHELAGGDVGY